MISAIFNYHKNLIKRHFIVIPLMFMYCTLYLTDRYEHAYSVYDFWGDCVIETLIAYFVTFYFVPAFFKRENYKRTDDMIGCKRHKQEWCQDSHRQPSLHSSLSRVSMADRYDHNRNSPSSRLHNSSLGKRFF